MISDYDVVAGVDEAGRGPLSGPVIAAAVILDPNKPIYGLKDSKKLSQKKLLSLYNEICEKSLCVAVGRSEPEEIDRINILQATLVAMERAINKLKILPDFIRVDGNRCPNVSIDTEAFVNGDNIYPEISAASIIAKVVRDREMINMCEIYPGYGFSQHKGYPTAIHLNALEKLGVSPIHRRTFKPVKKFLK